MAPENFGKNVICWKEQGEETLQRTKQVNSHRGTREFVEDSVSTQSNVLTYKKRICDATFIVDDPSRSALAQMGSSDIVKKPVSIVQPILVCEGQRSQERTPQITQHVSQDLDAEESDSELNCKRNFAQAVLCSRNKIALALAELLQDKQLEASEVLSETATSDSASDGGCLFREKSFKKRIDDRQHDLLQMDSEGELVFSPGESEMTPAPMCDSKEVPRPASRRPSMKIVPSRPQQRTKVLINSSQFESELVDRSEKIHASVKRKRVALCESGASFETPKMPLNFEIRPRDNTLMVPGAKSDHSSIPLTQYPLPSRSQSPRKVLTRTSHILRVSEGALRSTEKIEAGGVCGQSEDRRIYEDDLFKQRHCATLSTVRHLSGDGFVADSRKKKVKVSHEDERDALLYRRHDPNAHPISRVAGSTNSPTKRLLFFPELKNRKDRRPPREKSGDFQDTSLTSDALQNQADHEDPFTSYTEPNIERKDGIIYRDDTLISHSTPVASPKDLKVHQGIALITHSTPIVSRKAFNVNRGNATSIVLPQGLQVNGGDVLSMHSTPMISRKEHDVHSDDTFNTHPSHFLSQKDSNDKLGIMGKTRNVLPTPKEGKSENGAKVPFFESACARLQVSSPVARPSQQYNKRFSPPLCQKVSELTDREGISAMGSPSTLKLRLRKSSAPTAGWQDGEGNTISPAAGCVRKRSAMESTTIGFHESLPKKLAKRSLSLAGCSRELPCQTQSWERREQTTSLAQGKNIISGQQKRFSLTTMSLSPIKRPELNQHGSSPCKGSGRCGKGFCFQCS